MFLLVFCFLFLVNSCRACLFVVCAVWWVGWLVTCDSLGLTGGSRQVIHVPLVAGRSIQSEAMGALVALPGWPLCVHMSRASLRGRAETEDAPVGPVGINK